MNRNERERVKVAYFWAFKELLKRVSKALVVGVFSAGTVVVLYVLLSSVFFGQAVVLQEPNKVLAMFEAVVVVVGAVFFGRYWK